MMLLNLKLLILLLIPKPRPLVLHLRLKAFNPLLRRLHSIAILPVLS